MFPNSDTSETQSNETHECTAARRSRVKRLSAALLAAITLVVGITAAGQLSVAEAAGTVVAVDDAGADDEPGQKDLNWLSIDYGAPGATALTVKWGWDDTATSGANTRDAGSLFDTDGDGFANYSLYVTVAPTARTRRSFIHARPTVAPIAAPALRSWARSPRLRPWPRLQTLIPSAYRARRTSTRLT